MRVASGEASPHIVPLAQLSDQPMSPFDYLSLLSHLHPVLEQQRQLSRGSSASFAAAKVTFLFDAHAVGPKFFLPWHAFYL